MKRMRLCAMKFVSFKIEIVLLNTDYIDKRFDSIRETEACVDYCKVALTTL